MHLNAHNKPYNFMIYFQIKWINIIYYKDYRTVVVRFHM